MDRRRLDRRRLLMTVGAAAPSLAGATPAAAARTDEAAVSERGWDRDFRGMNVLLFITDQQRAVQHFPPGWEAKHLPGLTRLKRHGLSFERAFCNSCMCSPSRATLMTGFFPAQHGVKYTLEADMPAEDGYPQVELPPPNKLPNLATVMASVGYSTPYKGKWHLNKPASGVTDPATDPPCTPDEGWVPNDVNKYGFERWNPQDAGANQDVCQAGGGDVDNDGRFMHDDGPAGQGREGVLAYLRSAAAKTKPFFLTVGLVNPHDVLAYPSNFAAFGYDDSWLDSTGIALPETVDENLAKKPSAQRKLLLLTSPLRPKTTDEQRNYLNFYGNLMKSSDRYLLQILNTLEKERLLDSTLIIYTSDHGEMGMTHGGQIQKNFNAYEETMRVPLVFSSPRLYPTAKASQALVSHVDFLPTIASLFRVPANARANWQGVDYSTVVKNPRAKGPQEYVVFTFDDWQGGQASKPYVTGANRIVGVREGRYKLARYYDPDGEAPDEYEMYDLERDPVEKRNLAFPGTKRTKNQQRAYQRLRLRLEQVERTRLKGNRR